MAFITTIKSLNEKNLCKTINADGTVENYGKEWEFEFDEIEVNSIPDIIDAINTLRTDKYSAIVQGKFVGSNQSCSARNSETLADVPNNIVIWDFDRADIFVDFTSKESIMKGIKDLIAILPEDFQHTESAVKFSSTCGLKDDRLKCHVYQMLDRPYTRQELFLYREAMNIPADKQVLNHVQVVYTSDPLFSNGQDIHEQRVFHIEGIFPAVSLNISDELKQRAKEIQSSRTGEVSLQDTKEKVGLIGAFNRVFTVQQAIERFLSDHFAPSAKRANHYDWIMGSHTGESLFINGQGYCVNNSDSDPLGKRATSAFDFVRVHLFNSLDIGSFESMKNKPSFKAMQQLCESIPEVMIELNGAKQLLVKKEKDYIDMETIFSTPQKQDTSFDDFLNSQFEEANVSTKSSNAIKTIELPQIARTKLFTQQELELAKANITLGLEIINQRVNRGIDNLFHILKNDPILTDRLAWNEFTQKMVVLGDLPWRKVNFDRANEGIEQLIESDLTNIRLYIKKVYQVEYSKDAVFEGLNGCLQTTNSINPLKAYMEFASTNWDGVERLQTLFQTIAGVEDSNLNRAMQENWFIGCAKRALVPASQFDNCLVIGGDQGCMKTTFLKTISPYLSMYESLPKDITATNTLMALRGKCIVEIEEMNSVASNKHESADIKKFISTTFDTYRPPYERIVGNFDRTNGFAGTFNPNGGGIYRDETGGRRWWTIVIPQGEVIDIEWVKQHKLQLWGEATAKAKLGRFIHFETAELKLEAEEAAKEHVVDNGLVGIIQQYLDEEVPEGWLKYKWSEVEDIKFITEFSEDKKVKRQFTSMMEIAVECLGERKGNISPMTESNIRRAMSIMPGWNSKTDKQRRSRGRFGQCRVYSRINGDTNSKI